MRLTTLQAAFGSASILFAAQPVTATPGRGHRHAHEQFAKRHSHGHDGQLLAKRDSCSLPDHPDLVRVPGALNNGFAMSPDEECTTGKWCPYACVPGKVMAQWEPNTTYVYPESMVSIRPCVYIEEVAADGAHLIRTVACIAMVEY